MERKAFVFYKGWSKAIQDLPDDIRLEIYESIIEYATTGNLRGLGPIASVAFNFIKMDIDRDYRKYEQVSEVRSRCGAKGGRPKKTEEGDEKQTVFEEDEEKQKKQMVFEESKRKQNNPDKDIDKDIDIKKESTPKGVLKKDELSLPPSSVKNEPIDFKSLQETFNTMFADKLPMVQLLSPKRRAAVRARASEYGKSAIMDVFRKVQESGFLLGHNDRNWHCDFDWIFKPTNFIKILEGTYDNKSDNEIQAERAYTVRAAPNNKEASRAALEELADAILEQHQP